MLFRAWYILQSFYTRFRFRFVCCIFRTWSTRWRRLSSMSWKTSCLQKKSGGSNNANVARTLMRLHWEVPCLGIGIYDHMISWPLLEGQQVVVIKFTNLFRGSNMAVLSSMTFQWCISLRLGSVRTRFSRRSEIPTFYTSFSQWFLYGEPTITQLEIRQKFQSLSMVFVSVFWDFKDETGGNFVEDWKYHLMWKSRQWLFEFGGVVFWYI